MSGRLKGSESRIRLAGDRLSHRGPDDSGFYCDEFFGAYSRRLSILDTSDAGHQPMISSCGSYVIAFNGEIYNYKELRDFLESRGHVLKSHCDTEVVLALFQELGEAAVARLRGMFAFAVWDRKRMELTVFRDRLGIKPLYFYQEGSQILFASEIKSILQFSPQSRKHDKKSIFKYLARGWADDSNDTFFQKIKRVPAATLIRSSRDGTHEKTYWSLRPGEGRPFAPGEFQEKFLETVSVHLQADVPVASLLSGGIDSGSIVAAAARPGLPHLETFSLTSKNPPPAGQSRGGYKRGEDESPWINQIVQATRVGHSYVETADQDFSQAIVDCLKAHDEPFQESDCVHSFLLHREIAKRGFKVLLVGEGGDEVLGGYARFLFPYLYSLQEDGREKFFSAALPGAQEFLGVSREEILSRYAKYREMVESGGNGQENKSAYTLLAPEFIEQENDVVSEPDYPLSVGVHGNRFFAHLAHHIFKRDLPFHLRLTDRNAMAFGIESRPPMLDHEFVERLFSYDYAEFMKNGLNKAMLRAATRELLPASVIDRTSKEGRPGNNPQLVYGPLKDELRQMLLPGRAPDYFRKGCLELFEQDCASRNPERAVAWFRAYVLNKWIDTLESHRERRCQRAADVQRVSLEEERA